MRRVFRLIGPALCAALIAVAAWGQAPQQLPFPLGQMSIPEQGSAAASSNFVFLPSGSNQGNAKALYSVTIVTGASAGYVMVFDATVLPSNGAVTSCVNNTTRPCLLWSFNVAANSSLSMQWMSPMLAQTGIVVGFSTTAPGTLTASSTATIFGQAI